MPRGYRRLVLFAVAALVAGIGVATGTASAVAATGSQVTALSWATPHVDATSGTATDTLTWTVEYPSTDGQPDGHLTIGMASATPGQFLPNTLTVDFFQDGVSASVAESGTETTLTFSYRFTVPRSAFTTTPTYAVTSLTAFFGGSEENLTAAQLAQPPFGSSFTANAALDPGPSVSSLATTMPFTRAAGLGATENWTAVPATTQSAWTSLTFDLLAPDGTTLSVPIGNGTLSGPFDTTIPGGTPVREPAHLPTTVQDGTYTVQQVSITDRLGVTNTITAPANSSFIVTRNEVIGASGFLLSPNNVNDWASAQTVDLTMTTVSPAPITGAVVQLSSDRCVAGTPTFGTGSGAGTVTVPITVAEATTSCTVEGIGLVDSAGDASAFGPGFASDPNLPTFTAETGPAPTALGVSVPTEDQFDYDAGGSFDMSMQVSSWAPGVVDVQVSAYGVKLGEVTPNRQLSGEVGLSVTVAPRTPPGPLPLTVQLKDAAGATSSFSVTGPQIGLVNSGTFTAVTPVRLLDTRTGGGPVGAGKQISIPVGKTVPANATAVVFNLTATAPTASTFLTAWPDGQARPGTSNLNPAAGQTVANEITVPVGADGRVDVFNHVGSVQVIADLLGYYAPGEHALYQPITPVREFQNTPIGPNTDEGLTVFLNGNDLPNATALVLNVTVPNATADGFVTVWQGSGSKPTTSTVNFTKGQTVANQAVVPYNGEFRLYNSAGTNKPIIDLVGYYVDDLPGAAGSIYVPMTPDRVFDTRASHFPVGPNTSFATQFGVPATTNAVQLNVTGLNATANTFITVFPRGQIRPNTSSLNVSPHNTVTNAVTATMGTDGVVNFYNHVGTVDIVADEFGFFLP